MANEEPGMTSYEVEWGFVVGYVVLWLAGYCSALVTMRRWGRQ